MIGNAATLKASIGRCFIIAAGVILCVIVASLSNASASEGQVFDSERERFRVVTLVRGLDHPWGLAFLPGGDMLITERAGRLLRVDGQTHAQKTIHGLPAIAAVGQGGLLDIVLHPGFASNQLVYFSFAGADDDGVGTEVARGRLMDASLEGVEVIFRALPKSRGGRHFGSRLLFDLDGHLLITLGERGDQQRAQDIGDHAGSIVRINDDGSVPADNPFASTPGAKPEIYTYGNRNVQGIAMDPASGRVWAHEHGPQGGDEVNILASGRNYGWPVITYGRNYGTGTAIGEGTHKKGMEQPRHYWTPSIAPSGMTLYTGDMFPAWRGNLFVGALKNRLLVRLEVRDQAIIHEERLLQDVLGRIRDVRTGPDGYIYLLSDESDGVLARLEPA
ncbi:MAG: PQQ-dependent sugar dehydrogenase [Lysobacterales bacterium]|nr:MAG: PQQ-dependent sugar dehydrogenase [Xanthomonadales bacterium]